MLLALHQTNMGKKRLIRSEVYPYHVVVRSNNQEWFKINTANIWKILSDYLYFVSKAYEIKIHAVVLMSNHFHMLVSTPNCNLDSAMNYLMRECSRVINYDSKRINHTFGGPYKWSLITSANYYANALKYIYRNPVAVGAAKNVEVYPFSTLHGLLGLSHLSIPIEPPIADLTVTIPSDMHNYLIWLNTPYSKDSAEAISRGFRRDKFEFSICRVKRRIPEELSIPKK